MTVMFEGDDEEDQVDDAPDAGDDAGHSAPAPVLGNTLTGHEDDGPELSQHSSAPPAVAPNEAQTVAGASDVATPSKRSEPGKAGQDELATPPVRGAKEGTTQDQIVARNKERFANVGDNANQQSQLFLTERFLNVPGLRENYLKADDKGRALIMKKLVSDEANAQLGGYRGKDRPAKLKALEAHIGTLAMGLGDMPEFNPDPAPKDKKAAEGDVSLTAEMAVGAATGAGKGAAGLIGAGAALLGLAGGANEDRNALGRFADGVRKFSDDFASDMDAVKDRNTSAATKAERAEWERIKKEGSNYDVAKYALTSPRMWASEGAHMVGLLAPGLGAGGVVARGASATVKALTGIGNATKTAAAAGAAVAGGMMSETMAQDFEKEVLKQPLAKLQSNVGWWDTKHVLETARGKDVSDDEVSKVMARNMRDAAMKYDFPLATATMLIGPVGMSTLAKRFGVEVAEGYTGGAVTRAAKGAVAEGGSNAAQQYASDTMHEAIRQQAKAGDASLMSHVPDASGTPEAKSGTLDAAIMGGLMGGAMARKAPKAPEAPAKAEPTVPDAPIDPLAGAPTARPPRLPTGAGDAALQLPPRVDPPNLQAATSPTAPGNAVPSAPHPDVLAQAMSRAGVEPPRANVDELISRPEKPGPDTTVNPETTQALAAKHDGNVIADNGTIYGGAKRAIDASDPYHPVNSLGADVQGAVAEHVAQQTADPGYKLTEAVASDMVDNIVKAVMPEATPEAVAAVASQVRDTAATGGVVRPKIDKAEAKQLSYRETRRQASEAAQRVLGNSDYIAEIEAMAPGRVGDSAKYREWVATVADAKETRDKRPSEFTPEQQAIIAYDDVLRANRTLGPMAPSVRSTPRASIGERPASHVSSGRVTDIARDYVDNAMAGLGVNARVFDTHGHVGAEFGAVPENARAFIHTDTDGTTTVGLIADMLGTEGDVRAALEHEVVGHYKLERVLGEQGVSDLSQRVFAGIHRDPVSAEMWAGITRDYPLGDGVTLKDQVMEFVARVAETASDSQGARTTLQGVSDALKAAGYRATEGMTLPELRQLINDIRACKDPDYNPTTSHGYATEGQKLVVNPEEQVIRQTWWRRAERYLFDRGVDMNTMLRSLGLENGAAHNLWLSRESRKDRIVNGEILENSVKPLVAAVDALATKHGRTRDEIMHMLNDWAQARHRGERELWMRNTHAKLKSADLEAQRDKIMQGALAGTIEPRRAREMLDDLVTDETVANASDHLANSRYSGMTAAQADAIVAKMRDRGVLADFDALNAPDGELTTLRDVTKKYALSSGYYNGTLTAMAGYAAYIPAKGAEYAARATRPNTDGYSTVNEGRGAAGGRREMAEHGITQLMVEAQHMGNRHVDQQFMRNLTTAIETHPEGKTWGKVGEAQGIEYSGGEFTYPEAPNQFNKTDFAVTDPTTGKTRTLTLNDAGVADTLSRAHQMDDPGGALLRTLAAATRTMARTYTSFSPSFLTNNVIRDATAALEAIAFEKAPDGAPRRRFNKDQLVNVAKAMTTAYSRGDMRQLFMASQGEREVLMTRWRSGEEQARLREEYAGDPEGLQRTLDVREAAMEFVENGGVIGFGRIIDPAQTIKSADELIGAKPELPSNPLEAPKYAAQMIGHGLDAVTEKLESVGTYLDNAHRLGVYMGLTAMGVPKDAAMVRARTTSIDFNQRSGLRDGAVSGTIAGLYMFVQPGLTGLHSMFTRRIWRNGEMPLEVVHGPDGMMHERLKDGWHKELNLPVVTYLAALGYSSTMMAAMTMGQTNGQDNAERVATGSWFRAHLLPTSDKPLMIPQQVGMHQWFSGIGTMIALRQLGYADGQTLMKEYTNVILNHAVPGLKMQVPDGAQSTGQMLLSSVLPALAQPAGQLAMNRNAFGNTIYDEPNKQKPQFNSELGRKSTPQMFTDLATGVRKTTGLDWQPEVYQHLVGQLGFAGTTITELGKLASNPDAGKTAWDVAKLGPRRDFSGDSFEARQFSKYRDEVYSPLVMGLNEAKKADQMASDKLKPGRGKKDAMGPREAAFRAANPQVDAVMKADVGLNDARSILNQEAERAKVKGNTERAAAIVQIGRDMTREFLLMQKEGRLRDAPRALDRLVRQRLREI